MVRRLLRSLALAALCVPLSAASARAQQPSEPPSQELPDQDQALGADAPAHVSFVEGSVTLEREGRLENAPLNMPLLSGDRIRTSAGRVEIMYADDSTLFVDANTTLDFQSDDLLRLIDGRIRVSIPRSAQDVSYRIDSPSGSARLDQAGDYRISLLHGDRETQLELAVLRGAGEIFTDEGTTPVRAGERAYASAGLAPSYAYAYNSAAWDEFDRWTEARNAPAAGVSAQYLPEDMRSYSSVLDEYGDWRYAQSYGYVWYPRVDVGWRPYYYGRWMPYPRYGWTWVGIDRFGWPTHHYGRWGFSAGAWFWIPGARWSPAWVSWAYAPGYVSWCPLGFDNRPTFGINVSIGSRFYSPWTVVAAPHFGYGYVNQRVIQIDRVFDRRSRPVFVGRSSAPGFREVAVPRNSNPIRWAGSRRGAAGGIAGGARSGRDSYFTRESVQRDHAVERGSRAPLPAPARSHDGAATRSFGGTRTAPPSGGGVRRDVSPSTVPRAVPRAPQYGAPARQPAFENRGGIRRTTPDAVREHQPPSTMRRAEPRGYSTPQRAEPPAYSAPRRSDPQVYSMPRRAEPRTYSAPPAPQPLPRERGYAQPRGSSRPEMAAPRPMPAPQAPPRIERRAAPAPRATQGERAVPRQESRPSSPAPAAPRRSRGR